jgi:hypothetical protein
MRFRSRSAPRVEDAVRHLRAVLEVLDADLAQYHVLLATPIPAAILSDAEWDRAETARVAVEETLHELEQAAATAGDEASDWRAKAAYAATLGEPPLAEQARLRAAEADVGQRVYAQEAAAIHGFLDEWALRVTRAAPGRPGIPPANER